MMQEEPKCVIEVSSLVTSFTLLKSRVYKQKAPSSEDSAFALLTESKRITEQNLIKYL